MATVNFFSKFYLFLSLSKHSSFIWPGSCGLSFKSTLHLICFSFCFYSTKSAIYFVGLTCLVGIFDFSFIGEGFFWVNIFIQLKRSCRYFSIFSNLAINLAFPLLWFNEPLFSFPPKSTTDPSFFIIFFVFFSFPISNC